MRTATTLGGIFLFGVIGILIFAVVTITHSKQREVERIKKSVTPRIRKTRLIEQKIINKDKVKTFIELRKSEIKDLMNTLDNQFEKNLISENTYMELKNKYTHDISHVDEKTCHECGLINDKDASFCIRCGTRL